MALLAIASVVVALCEMMSSSLRFNSRWGFLGCCACWAGTDGWGVHEDAFSHVVGVCVTTLFVRSTSEVPTQDICHATFSNAKCYE